MNIQHIIYKHMALTAVLLTALAYTAPLHAQTPGREKETQEEAILREAVDSKNFVFKAQTIVPMNGMSRQLNASYDLTVSSDKIISFLPYMGRLYTAPIDPAQGPLRFTSSDFEYNIQPGKKGGWQISIKPKDVRSVREFNLSITESGYATLQVNGNDRQPVTFYGYVTETEG
ncbi:MAG: DUF4251 domain-containing protein [Chitinophagaceae bacterium]|nr:DUF4251 domain-containing protein [Chitinophagaceae bacterium]